MKTRVLTVHSAGPDDPAISEAARLLSGGQIVALPTETVYGLAADATNPSAAAAIFTAKQRPPNDPLIVHLPCAAALCEVANPPPAIRSLLHELTSEFWPGPFTVVLPATEATAPAVRAGLKTIAVRMSAHPVFAAVAQTFSRPIAAPSANRFGRISPTEASHVLAELDGRIPFILDAGPTPHGIESTIIRLDGGAIEILRPGPVTIEQLRRFAPVTTARSDKPAAALQPEAPGLLPVHYAPETPVTLLPAGPLVAIIAKQAPHSALLAWNLANWPSDVPPRFAALRELSPTGAPEEGARNLYRHLREIDQLGLSRIFVEPPPPSGLGLALLDRITRASAATI